MWLPWQTAFQLAVALGVAVALISRRALAPTAAGWLRGVRTTAIEITLVLVLYGVWQWVHERAVTKTAGAIDHARALYRFEQAIHLPSELSVQNLFIHHRLAMQFLNVYYGGAHVTAVGILLVWLFVRHRADYRRVRNTLALSIAGCLAIQTIPVAPPRFLPDLGFVDAGLLYHLSVYGPGGSGISNQVAAMPSLHVGWAVLVGVVAVTVGRGRWKWLVLAHPVLTVLAVVATANHWWLDGVVAVMVLALAYLVVRGVELASASVRNRRRRADPVRGVDPADPGEPGVDVPSSENRPTVTLRR